MPRLFAPFSRRALLAPLSLLYFAGSALHRALWLRPSRARPPATPLWVIGSLRAGGAGKTAVTLELARRLTASGRRVGILVYRLEKGREKGPEKRREKRRETGAASNSIFSERNFFNEIFPESDWRDSSDEAVLLARASGARVFATRRRDLAWSELSRSGAFDVLLSDDGLMDARLRGATRIALVRPGERPGWSDLLPGGPYRLTAAALKTVDQVWEGPLVEEEARGETPGIGSRESGLPPGSAKVTAGFRREPVFPEGFDPSKTYWALCGLGDPIAFRRALERAGARLAGLSAGPDHGLPDLAKARRAARRAGAAGFLYSAKDAVKLEERLRPEESTGCVRERVSFVPNFGDAPGLAEFAALLDAPSGPPSS